MCRCRKTAHTKSIYVAGILYLSTKYKCEKKFRFAQNKTLHNDK